MKPETRNEKQQNWRLVWLTRYLPLLIWIAVIFFFSSGQGSMPRTSLIIRPILEFLFPSADEQTLLFYHGVIRKLAHFTEYAVLGFLACRAFAFSARKYSFLIAVGLVVLVAVADETNQSFNPERTGSPVDVLIDVGGGLSAVLIVYMLTKRRSKERPGDSQASV